VSRGEFVPGSQDPVVSQFLSLEATPQVRALLLGAIAEATGNPKVEKRHFEFNVFDVEIDFVASTVSVAEVLSANVEATLSLSQFRAALAAVTLTQP
jgi:hypothetical protein